MAAALAFALALAGMSVQARPLRAVIKADPATIDPLALSELVSTEVLSRLYERFTRIGLDGGVEPALAVKWQELDDGRGWRFHLRPGVVFHSGRPLTAWDVKWSFERLLRPDGQGGVRSLHLHRVLGAQEMLEGRATDLAGVRVVDDRTVEVRFTQPEVLFPIMPVFIADRGMEKEHGPNWYEKASGGTGPFRFGEWRRGERIVLPAFARHWRGAPTVDAMVYRIERNPEAALGLYDDGHVDVLDVPEPMIRRVLGSDRYIDQWLLVPRAQARGAALNPAHYPPFRDPRVREAVELSVDQAELARTVYLNAATVEAGVVPAGLGGYRPDLPRLRHDPDRARALLAEAGFPGGRGLPPVELTGVANLRADVETVARQLRDTLGFPVAVRIIDRETYFKEADARAMPFFVWGWTANYTDPMDVLGTLWQTDSPFNRTGWSNPRFDAFLAEARKRAEPRDRFPLYAQAERLLIEDRVTIPLPTPMYVILRKPWAKRATMSTLGVLSLDRVLFR